MIVFKFQRRTLKRITSATKIKKFANRKSAPLPKASRTSETRREIKKRRRQCYIRFELSTEIMQKMTAKSLTKFTHRQWIFIKTNYTQTKGTRICVDNTTDFPRHKSISSLRVVLILSSTMTSLNSCCICMRT